MPSANAEAAARTPKLDHRDDPLRRTFTADGPNRLWLTDITDATGESKLYLGAVKDACFGRIVGYSINARMKSRLAVGALESAVARRSPAAGCIVHSDRESPFRSRKVAAVLSRNGLASSMGRVGAASDNAAMESFFALLQKNVLARRTWTARQESRNGMSPGSSGPTTGADGNDARVD
ncbi:DDE-type integrase/transposase/recombinase [Streptomyces albidoflavus]|uniref:DDE-type integrase/transposase/recombinase n=1 Tax=Streptomyces albidoflavus TaxID=1886 RepID=UPI003439B65E